jgi:apolipoprotein N-acyltransferase
MKIHPQTPTRPLQHPVLGHGPAYVALKIWRRVRIITGVLVIFAGIATAVNGFVALSNERDTSSAMKLPAALAVVCLVAFVHAQRQILAIRKPSHTPQATPPEGGST